MAKKKMFKAISIEIYAIKRLIRKTIGIIQHKEIKQGRSGTFI